MVTRKDLLQGSLISKQINSSRDDIKSHLFKYLNTLRTKTYPEIYISPLFIELSNFYSFIASTSKDDDIKTESISSICLVKLFIMIQAILKPLTLLIRFKGGLLLCSVNVDSEFGLKC